MKSAVSRLDKTEECKGGCLQPKPATNNSSNYLQKVHNRRVIGNQLQLRKQSCGPAKAEDEFEKEADAVAETVVKPAFSDNEKKLNTHGRQTRCSQCENKLQKKAKNSPVNNISPSVQQDNIAGVMTSGGRSLDTNQREYFSGRMGYDFSQVVIHNNGEAERSAASLNARAYTFGNHIVFGKNEFQPDSLSGKKLLAHELTHVIQQNGGAPRIQRQPATAESEGVVEQISSEAFDLAMPVGRGFYVEALGGITWGYPVHTGAEVTFYIKRISESHLSVKVYKKGKIGFDTGVGAGFYIGSKGKPGSKKKGWGVGGEAGANVEAGIAGVAIEEYQIPVSQFIYYVGKQALISAGEQVVGTATGGLATPAMNFLNTSADQYRTHQRLEIHGYGTAAAEAFAGIRRPGDDVEKEKGTTKGFWTPGDDRQSIASRPSTWDADPLALLNFLSVAVGAGANAKVGGGLDQEQRGKEFITKLYLEGEFSTMMNIPIPGLSQILQTLPTGAGGGVDISFHQSPGKKTQIKINVYLKRGEDQLYQGNAHQETFSFNVTDLLSPQDIMRAINTGTIPPGLSSLDISKAFETVNFWTRFSLFGTLGRNFNTFKRRQQGVRSLLSDKTKNKADNLGLTFVPYLTLGMDMSGPNFIALSKKLWEIAKQAHKSTAGSHDIQSTYEALKKFLTTFVVSKEFENLTDMIFDSTYVNTAELLLQYGGNIAVSGKLAKGAKVRGDISAGAGMFCFMDYMKTLGKNGKITLREFMDAFPDVLENPLKYMPDCPLLSLLFAGGGSGDGSGGPGDGNSKALGSQGTGAGDNMGSGAGTSKVPPKVAGGGQQQQESSKPTKPSKKPGGGVNTIIPGNQFPQDSRALQMGVHIQRFLTEGVENIEDLRVGTIYRSIVRVQYADDKAISIRYEYNVNVQIDLKLVTKNESSLVFEVAKTWWVPTNSLPTPRIVKLEGAADDLTEVPGLSGIGSKLGFKYNFTRAAKAGGDGN